MKICPKCGFVETEYWRQNRWRTNVEFSPVSEFRLNHPKISQLLEDGHGIQTDKYYAYRLSGKRKTIVERVWIEQYKIDGKKAFHIPREHVEHKKDPWQKTLTVKAN